MSTLPKPHIFKAAESKPLRWGIFGAGWISEAMVKTAQLNSNQEFVARAPSASTSKYVSSSATSR
jgi:hypothetical protein